MTSNPVLLRPTNVHGSIRAILTLLALSVSCTITTRQGTSWLETHTLPERWDGGFLSQEPCGPPCFAGIVPGKTSLSDAIRITEENNLLRQCQLEDRPNQGLWLSCQGAVINIDPETDTVDSVGFLTSDQITMAQVIMQYEDPDELYLIPDGVPEHPYIIVIACFHSISARVDLERQEWPNYEISPSSLVTNIVYVTGVPCFDGLDNWRTPWDGYGEY